MITFQLRPLLYLVSTHMRCGDVPETRPFAALCHTRVDSVAITCSHLLGISMSEVHPCDDFLNLLLAFTELGRFNVSGFPKTGQISTLSPLGHIFNELCTPSGIRTRTVWSLKPSPLPVGLQGHKRNNLTHSLPTTVDVQLSAFDNPYADNWIIFSTLFPSGYFL